MATNNKLPQGYIPNKQIKDIEKSFKQGGFGAVQDFINNNFTLEPTNALPNIPVAQPKQNQLTSISFQYLNDSGDGRIGMGVLSLEAITKVLKGVPVHALTLFDQVIYTDPSEFFSTDKTSLRQAVYDNLGMSQFLSAALVISPTSVNNLNVVVDAIITDMKNLTFTYDDYIDTALGVCKAVVSAAIKFNG